MKRNWVAKCQYPGLNEFLFGTVFAESELEAERALIVLLNETVPVMPKMLAILPGAVVFHDESTCCFGVKL